MITEFDLLLVCLVGLAFTLSKQPKRTAVGVCAGALVALVAGDYFLTGVTFYWFAFGLEVSAGYVLWFLSQDAQARHDRMYYRALSAFMAISCAVTGLYIYDIGAYASHSLYAATSHWIGVSHALFMVAFSDTAINSGVFRKGVAFVDSVFSRTRIGA